MNLKTLFATRTQIPIGPDGLPQEPSSGFGFGSDPEKIILWLFAFFIVLVAIIFVLSALGMADLSDQIVLATLGYLGGGVYYVLKKRRRR